MTREMTTEEAIEYLTRCADGLDPDFECAVSMAVSAIRAQQNGGWISVKDRLPEEPEEEYPEYIVMIENSAYVEKRCRVPSETLSCRCLEYGICPKTDTASNGGRTTTC